MHTKSVLLTSTRVEEGVTNFGFSCLPCSQPRHSTLFCASSRAAALSGLADCVVVVMIAPCHPPLEFNAATIIDFAILFTQLVTSTTPLGEAFHVLLPAVGCGHRVLK